MPGEDVATLKRVLTQVQDFAAARGMRARLGPDQMSHHIRIAWRDTGLLKTIDILPLMLDKKTLEVGAGASGARTDRESRPRTDWFWRVMGHVRPSDDPGAENLLRLLQDAWELVAELDLAGVEVLYQAMGEHVKEGIEPVLERFAGEGDRRLLKVDWQSWEILWPEPDPVLRLAIQYGRGISFYGYRRVRKGKRRKLQWLSCCEEALWELSLEGPNWMDRLLGTLKEASGRLEEGCRSEKQAPSGGFA